MMHEPALTPEHIEKRVLYVGSLDQLERVQRYLARGVFCDAQSHTEQKTRLQACSIILQARLKIADEAIAHEGGGA